MTQISGKIYQMWNAAGTEKRFPRTVIEAVYGLSSYLQQQFASLADIYMPIEGITEAKTGQEFVFRKAVNTKKVNTLTIDRIVGKTLAWNQLVPQNGFYTSSVRGVDFTNNGDGSMTVNGTASGGTAVDTWAFSFISGHKYYIPSYWEAKNVVISANNTSSWSASAYGVFTATTQNAVIVSVANGTQANSVKVYPQLFDLTLMFGAGNEPSTVAEFEALYSGYHDYSAGKLISNDASALETTGFNQWDEETELGGVNDSGEKTSSSSALRTKNYIPMLPSTAYFINTNKYTRLCCYDANKNFLGTAPYTASGNGYITTTLAGTAFGLVGFTNSYGTTYNHDICINLSDATRNGQYEPYWKRTLNLGLNSFKVKSHNIWDEEWEVGSYNTSTGEKDNTVTTTIRCKNKIPVLGGETYYFKSIWCQILYYDANEDYLGYAQTGDSGGNVTIRSDAAYMTFRVASNYGTTYNNDICINVSSSFNGQYEPHGILTMTGGVKSAGSVYDEIVGNKYIKRVGEYTFNGDEGWIKNGNAPQYTSQAGLFVGRKRSATYWSYPANILHPKLITASQGEIYAGNVTNAIGAGDSTTTDNVIIDEVAYTNRATLLTGTTAHYELATPIEYELAEPLVPTVKAGTTEARISPNADGLSAPFCCDMTYSAGTVTDAANSQYAATAGKLLNSHKLWGQDFDGSDDVSGALTGVGNISMNGTITGVTTINGTAIQISGSGKVTVSSLQCSGDANFEEGIYLDTSGYRHLWYDEDNDRVVMTLPSGEYAYFTQGIVSASYITAGASSSSSDARLKDNVTSVTTERALSIFSALNGKEWDWNDKMTAFEGQHCSGLVAQEVQKVMPWAVYDYNDSLSLNYNCLWGIAIPVIQNLIHRVEELESKLKTN